MKAIPSPPLMQLQLSSRRITSFFGLKELGKENSYTEIDVRENLLTSFEHFGTHTELRSLHADNNDIESLLGMTKQKSLEHITIRGNPLAKHPHYRLMALLTIGFSLRTIDGERVEPHEREAARKLGPSAALAVSYGWLLDPLPRTAEEYDAIIVELRKARRLRHDAPQAQVRTVPMALAELVSAQHSNSAAQGTHTESSLTVTQETVELQSRALLHFSKRVTQLEHHVTELQGALMRERAERAREAHARSSCSKEHRQELIKGISADEIGSIGEIVFTKGLRLRCNVQQKSLDAATHNNPTPVCIVVSKDSICFQHFFSRNRIAEFPVDDLVSAHFDVAEEPYSMVLQTLHGGVFSVEALDALVLTVVHKLLFLAKGESVVTPKLQMAAEIQAKATPELLLSRANEATATQATKNATVARDIVLNDGNDAAAQQQPSPSQDQCRPDQWKAVAMETPPPSAVSAAKTSHSPQKGTTTTAAVTNNVAHPKLAPGKEVAAPESTSHGPLIATSSLSRQDSSKTLSDDDEDNVLSKLRRSRSSAQSVPQRSAAASSGGGSQPQGTAPPKRGPSPNRAPSPNTSFSGDAARAAVSALNNDKTEVNANQQSDPVSARKPSDNTLDSSDDDVLAKLRKSRSNNATLVPQRLAAASIKAPGGTAPPKRGPSPNRAPSPNTSSREDSVTQRSSSITTTTTTTVGRMPSHESDAPQRDGTEQDTGTPSAAPPVATAPRSALNRQGSQAATTATAPTSDGSSSTPPPKRATWRGKEIRELLIDSDSD